MPAQPLMAKKRGKSASSTPSSSGNRKDHVDTNTIDMDELKILKDADISDLSPEEANKVHKVLEGLANKIRGKEETVDSCDQNNKHEGNALGEESSTPAVEIQS
ncbi:hypothetical protein RIF29_30524 [Crotalaria pallida]|uniref:Uncharacterized protein n=1 Tax=Crotalaria pallida TaxID=3830 RepID=A0AAN9EID4_CROPI